VSAERCMKGFTVSSAGGIGPVRMSCGHSTDPVRSFPVAAAKFLQNTPFHVERH
jgi:hypothetical protein